MNLYILHQVPRCVAHLQTREYLQCKRWRKEGSLLVGFEDFFFEGDLWCIYIFYSKPKVNKQQYWISWFTCKQMFWSSSKCSQSSYFLHKSYVCLVHSVLASELFRFHGWLGITSFLLKSSIFWTPPRFWKNFKRLRRDSSRKVSNFMLVFLISPTYFLRYQLNCPVQINIHLPGSLLAKQSCGPRFAHLEER